MPLLRCTKINLKHILPSLLQKLMFTECNFCVPNFLSYLRLSSCYCHCHCFKMWNFCSNGQTHWPVMMRGEPISGRIDISKMWLLGASTSKLLADFQNYLCILWLFSKSLLTINRSLVPLKKAMAFILLHFTESSSL